MPRESTIKIQRSDTPAATPSGLTAGELAVNLADRKLFVGGTAGSNITFLDSSAVVTSFNGLTGAVTGVTAGGANTFTALNSFSAGISASALTVGGGVTFSGTFSGATASFSKLLSASAGVSASALTVTTTGNANKTAAINMASGVTATNLVASQITLNAYSADAFGIPPAPFTKSGYISTTQGGDLILSSEYAGSQILLDNGVIYIGDVDANNDGTMITLDSVGPSVDITGALNINGYNVFPSSSVVTTAAALSNVSTAQNAFPVGQQTLTVAENTTYLIEGEYVVNSGTTTHTTAIGFTVGGDVMDLSGLEFSAVLWSAAANTITTTQSSIHVTANASTQTVLNATSTAAVTTIQIKGVWKNTSNTTITPKIKFSAAPGGTNQMAAGSYIRFTPIANPLFGSWT